MINRVEPKIVDLIKRVPGVTIRNHSGPGHYVFIMHCNTAPFDNNDLRMALKLAMDREEMLDKILRGYGSLGNDFPINASYPLFSDDIEQRKFDPDKAAFHYKKSGHSGSVLLRTSEVAFPGAVDAAQLYQQSCAKAGITVEVKREPGDGYWSEVWNKQPFSTSYWGGRSTQDQMYSTAYISTADWNDTRFLRPDFDKMVLAARAELDQAKRKAMYHDMAVIVRDEGGLILPMFNDFIDATGPKVDGWVDDPHQELMQRLRTREVLARGLMPAVRRCRRPSLKLVAQRIALGILLLLAVSVLIFAGTQILPGDVAQSILGQSATPESLANLRERARPQRSGLCQVFPLARRRADRRSRHGPVERAGHRDVDQGGRLWNTLFLAFWAAIVAVPLAIILGLIAVRYRNGWVDKLISGLALASTSLPEFFIGYLLVYFFAVKLQMFPGISTVYDGMPFGERMQAIALAGDGADAGGARPHDAHDARRDPQRHAVGLYRDGGAEGAVGRSTSSAGMPFPTPLRRSSTS